VPQTARDFGGDADRQFTARDAVAGFGQASPDTGKSLFDDFICERQVENVAELREFAKNIVDRWNLTQRVHSPFIVQFHSNEKGARHLSICLLLRPPASVSAFTTWRLASLRYGKDLARCRASAACQPEHLVERSRPGNDAAMHSRNGAGRRSPRRFRTAEK